MFVMRSENGTLSIRIESSVRVLASTQFTYFKGSHLLIGLLQPFVCIYCTCDVTDCKTNATPSVTLQENGSFDRDIKNTNSSERIP